MNHLVFLDPHASELEKIHSGIKSMILKELDASQVLAQPVRVGDSLYFLRNNDECELRVRATVTHVIPFTNAMDEDLSHTLKEFQPRLQLTEDQYNYWSEKQQILLVEFECAHKIDMIHVASNKITDRSGWVAFDGFGEIT